MNIKTSDITGSKSLKRKKQLSILINIFCLLIKGEISFTLKNFIATEKMFFFSLYLYMLAQSTFKVI